MGSPILNARDAVMNHEGKIVLTGTTRLTDNAPLSPFFAIVDDISGDIIYTNFYTESENSNLAEIDDIINYGDTFIAQTVRYDSITSSYDYTNFSKLNETGTIIETATFPRQFIYSSTGGIYSYGRWLSDEFFTFSVCKHSSTDLSVIEDELILDYDSRFSNVYPDHNGGIICRTREDEILRLNENLDTVWDYPESHFGDLIYPGLEYTLVDFFRTSDGGYMVMTGHWNVFSGTKGLLKLDADGNSE